MSNIFARTKNMQFFFAIPGNLLSVSIIRTDTSWIISFKYQIVKEDMAKKDLVKINVDGKVFKG